MEPFRAPTVASASGSDRRRTSGVRTTEKGTTGPGPLETTADGVGAPLQRRRPGLCRTQGASDTRRVSVV